jgi:hypothetical protein
VNFRRLVHGKFGSVLAAAPSPVWPVPVPPSHHVASKIKDAPIQTRVSSPRRPPVSADR